MAGSRPASKPKLGTEAEDSTRISHSAEGPLKLRLVIATGSKEWLATAWVKPHPAAMHSPVTTAPTASQGRPLCWR